MRKMFNRILHTMIALLLLFTLTSCGTPAAKSEADIRVDIQKEDRCFSDYSLKIKSSTITKRQTNQDDKTDYVWVELTAENDAFTYQAEYELMYVLYNDGWLLEKFKNTASDIIPLSYPTLEEATAEINRYAGGCTYMDSAKSERSVSYQFEREETVYYLTTRYRTILSYQFDPSSGWTSGISEIELENRPDIVGEWLYQDSERYFYVNILSLEDQVVTLEYDLENIHISTYETANKKTDVPVKMDLNGDKDGYSIALDRYSVYGNIHIYVGISDKKLTDSTGCGVSCDGFFLKKIS